MGLRRAMSRYRSNSRQQADDHRLSRSTSTTTTHHPPRTIQGVGSFPKALKYTTSCCPPPLPSPSPIPHVNPIRGEETRGAERRATSLGPSATNGTHTTATAHIHKSTRYNAAIISVPSIFFFFVNRTACRIFISHPSLPSTVNKQPPPPAHPVGRFHPLHPPTANPGLAQEENLTDAHPACGPMTTLKMTRHDTTWTYTHGTLSLPVSQLFAEQ